MTVKEAFEYVLIDINKVESASLLLKDFNYLLNKGIYQKVNTDYAFFESDQQFTDSLRVLKTTAVIDVTSDNNIAEKYGNSPQHAATYEVELPSDYLHCLNCSCVFKMNKKVGCTKAGSYYDSVARKAVSNNVQTLYKNAYFKPSYKNPYWYITHVNSSNDLPTNPYTAGNQGSGLGIGTDGKLSRTIKISDITESLVNRTATHRYGNASTVRLELRCGTNATDFELTKVFVEYIKCPQYIELTEDQYDLEEDTSQILEFPDYICYEIINGLAKLLLENAGDPRLQSFIPINTTIAPPIQQQSQTKK